MLSVFEKQSETGFTGFLGFLNKLEIKPIAEFQIIL